MSTFWRGQLDSVGDFFGSGSPQTLNFSLERETTAVFLEGRFPLLSGLTGQLGLEDAVFRLEPAPACFRGEELRLDRLVAVQHHLEKRDEREVLFGFRFRAAHERQQGHDHGQDR